MEYDWDEEDDAEDPTLPCPNCGVEIYADADRCAQCGHYVTDYDTDATGGSGTPAWILITAIVLLILLALSFIGPLLG